MVSRDFKIGMEFFCGLNTNKFRCTDVGFRTIAAIKLDQEDESNYNGPPYSVLESVFDENDLMGCYLEDSENYILDQERERSK